MTRIYEPPASEHGRTGSSAERRTNDEAGLRDAIGPAPPLWELPTGGPTASAGPRAMTSRGAAWRRSALWIALVVAALAVTGFSIRQFSSPVAAASEYTVRRGDLHQVVAARGRLQPRAEIAVAAKLIGRVTSVFVREGERVKAGQLVALLDDAELRATLAQTDARVAGAMARLMDLTAGARPQEIAAARAQVNEFDAVLAEADAALQRFTELSRVGLISASQFDDAQRRRSVAEAQHRSAVERLAILEAGPREDQRRAAQAELSHAESERMLARAELENARVTAPASGVVLRRYMEPGEVIVLQRPQPILTIADDTRVFVRAEVDEVDVPRLRIGQTTRVTAAGFSQEFIGRVAEIGRTAGRKVIASDDPSEIQDTRVVEVGIEMPKGIAWTFGTTAEVEIEVVDQSDALVVPRAAVESEGNGDSYVRLLTAGSASRQAVRLGASDEAYVEILEGLHEGDVVLVPSVAQ